MNLIRIFIVESAKDVDFVKLLTRFRIERSFAPLTPPALRIASIKLALPSLNAIIGFD